ncbi:MAG: IS1595 family transposase [Terracidiphilus sp.]|jgi:transposase-like protein
MNLYSLARKFPTEEHALAHLMKVRWPSGIRCLKCDHDKCWLVESLNKTGKPRRLFQCAQCKHQFSATTGTLFHDSHLPLSKWFASIALMAEAKKGISAMQLMRHVGMTYKTAWYVCHRIREAMTETNPKPLGGQGQIVEIDESFVGGKLPLTSGKPKNSNKIKVFGIAERGGRVHLQTVASLKIEHIKPVMDAMISPEASKIATDGTTRYKNIIPEGKHIKGDHAKEIKSGDPISNQTIEGVFSLFKRGLIGQYHQLSRWHLDRYLGEFCWRYNRRGLQPWIFGMTLNNMVCRKPLPYKELVKF